MKSADFGNISEYGIEKVRSSYRYYSDLPCDRMLSPVISGICSRIICEVIRLHPKNQKELMILLRRYETETEVYELHAKRIKSEGLFKFLGKCFVCGKRAHRKDQYRIKQPRFASSTNTSVVKLNKVIVLNQLQLNVLSVVVSTMKRSVFIKPPVWRLYNGL